MTHAMENIISRRANPLAAVIVSYNSAEVLPGLLSSLHGGLSSLEDYDVVVVDNASSDDSVAIAESHPIGARVIESGRNAGYAAAINIAGNEIDPAADMLVLNPDIRLFEHTVPALRDCLRDPAIGVAVPQILEETGELSLSLRREPSIATAWIESVVGGAMAQRLALGEVLADRQFYSEGGDVDWATGAILLISSEARRRVDAWDESFFLYSEEVDFMRRVRESGFKVRYHPAAKAIHIGGETRANPFLYSLSTVNRVLDYSHRHGWAATTLFHGGVVLGEALRSWRGREHRAALQALLRYNPLGHSGRALGKQLVESVPSSVSRISNVHS